MRPFVSITLRTQAWFWRSPPSGPRGRREKLIWSLAQECKSLPAKRLEIKLSNSTKGLIGSACHTPLVGLAEGESQGHRSTNAESLSQVGDLRALGTSSWYLATCISRGAVTGPGKGSGPWYPPECIQAPRHVLQRCALLAQGDCLGDQDATLCRDWATIAKVVEQAHGP